MSSWQRLGRKPVLRQRSHGEKRCSVLPLCVLAATLAGCGGGGGSSGGAQNGPPGNTDNGVSMSVSAASIAVSATNAQSAPSASLQVSVSGLANGQSVYLSSKYSESGIFLVGQPGNSFPATVPILFKAPEDLGVGVYKDVAQIMVCTDQACTQQVSNSPQTVQVQYTVTAAPPTLTALSPGTASAGGAGFLLVATGTNFTRNSSLVWNGHILPSSSGSSTDLSAEISSADIAAAGSVPVSVEDPVGGSSNALSFTVTSTTLAALSPTSVTAAGPPFTLTVTGTRFTSQSILIWNRIQVPTTFISSTELRAQVSASGIATAGSVPVYVYDPQAGNSNTVSFTVQPAALGLVSVFPTSVTAGDPAFMLTVFGNDFTGSSVVQWNGTALPTTLVSNYELTAQVTAAEVATAGTVPITVQDSTSPVGTTSAHSLTISAASVDATSFLINPAHTGAVTLPSVSFPAGPAWSVQMGGKPSYALIVGGRVFVTVSLTGGGSELLALDGATGATLWGPVKYPGGAANAVYDNGRVFVINSDPYSNNYMAAYDAATGTADWSTPLGSIFNMSPTAADGLVFITEGSANWLFALDESTGAISWEQQMGAAYATPAVTADGVYQACRSLTPSTGALIWSNTTNCVGGGTPVVANQLLYSPSAGNRVGPGSYDGYILDPGTGNEVGTYTADDPPAFTGTMGYFVQNGTLEGVSVPDDTVQWSFKPAPESVAGAPIVVNQYVILSSGDFGSTGAVYALDGSTGAQVWFQPYGTGTVDTAFTMATGPQSGLAAGDGLLVVPVGTTLYGYFL
ncbi:MAG TPA: PQQ-binding-like beta-propeller repeat protein [Steroidobacteraceae bacterium]|nr:PQQ-binding-like beta-propeller repeat protein [Steroidobacteraceae bacterium]